MTPKEINKLLKPKTPLLFVSIGLFALSVIVYIVAFLIKPTPDKAIDYRELLLNYKNISGEYTKLDIVSAYSFAGKGNLTYYYVLDEDGYLYVARLTDDTFDDMVDKYNSCPDQDKFTYEIHGYVCNVYGDLKDYMISELDDVFGEEYKISYADYDDMFYDTYIDETSPGKATTFSLFIALGAVCDIVGLLMLILYLTRSSRIRKSLKQYNFDVLYSQLSSSETLCYKKEGIYLCSQYVVSTVIGLRILNYYDIKWIYNIKNSVNGIPTAVNLVAACSDKNTYNIASTMPKNENVLIEIMQEIYARDTDILVGYSNENIQAYKEFKKNN